MGSEGDGLPCGAVERCEAKCSGNKGFLKPPPNLPLGIAGAHTPQHKYNIYTGWESQFSDAMSAMLRHPPPDLRIPARQNRVKECSLNGASVPYCKQPPYVLDSTCTV